MASASITSLSTSYYMRSYYSNNRNVISKSGRKNYTQSELSYEDSLALHRAAKKLKNFDYSKDDEQDSLVEGIAAFVETYNNTLSSNASNKRILSKLNTLTGKYSDQLSDLGITVNKDGTLTASENLLKASDMSDLKEMFSSDSSYMNSLQKVSRTINNSIKSDLYTQMTQKGLNINITL